MNRHQNMFAGISQPEGMDVPKYNFNESCLPASELQEGIGSKQFARAKFNKKKKGKSREKHSLDDQYHTIVEHLKTTRKKGGNVSDLEKQLAEIKKTRKHKRAYAQSLPSLQKTGVYLLDTLKALIEYFKTMRDVVGEDVLKWLLDLSTTLYNIYNRPEWDSFLLNISSFFLRNFPQRHAEYAVEWFKAAFQVATTQSLMDYKDFIISLFEKPYDFLHDELWSNISEFIVKVVALYGSVVEAVSVETLDFPTIVKQFNLFRDKCLDDTKDIVEMCFNAYEFVLGNWDNIVSRDWDKILLGKDETKVFELEVRELEQAFPLVISNKEFELMDKYKMTPEKYQSRLENSIKKAKSLINRCSSAQQRMSVSNFIKSMTEKQAELYARISDAPEKDEAYAIKLAGPSSCGKSTMVNILSKTMLHAYEFDPEARGSVVFTNISEKYESTIMPSHKIICADDVANNKNEKPNYDRILNYVNTVPRPLEKADVKEKGILYPGNSAFIATTNDETIRAMQSSSCPESILRRFNLHVSVNIKEPFRNEFGGLMKFDDGSFRFDVYDLTLKRFRSISEDEKGNKSVEWQVLMREEWNPDERDDFEAMCTFVAQDIAKHRHKQTVARESKEALKNCPFCKIHLTPTFLCGCKPTPEAQVGNFFMTLNTAELWDIRSALSGCREGIAQTYRKGLLYRKIYRDRHVIWRILCGVIGSFFIGSICSRSIAQVLFFSNMVFGYFYYKQLVREIDEEISRRSDRLSSLCVDIREHLRNNVKKYFAAGAAVIALHQAYLAMKPFFCQQTQDTRTFFDGVTSLASTKIKSPEKHCFVQENDVRDYKEGYSRVPPAMSRTAKTTTSKDLQQKVAKSLRVVVLKSRGEHYSTHNGIMVASNVIMVPAHGVPETFPFTVETSTTPGVPSAKTKDQKLTERCCFIDREHDVAFIHLPSAPASTSFIEFFPESYPNFRARGSVLLWKSPQNEVKISQGPVRELYDDMEYYGYQEKPGRFYGVTSSMNKYTLQKGKGLKADLEFPAFSGLCGGLYLDYTKALIYGFHVAGYSGEKEGFLTCVTKPMIENALNHLKQTSPTLVVHSLGDLRVDTYGLPYTVENGKPLYLREDGTGSETVVTYHGKVLKSGMPMEERSRTPYMETPFKGIPENIGQRKHRPPKKPNDVEKGMKTLNKLTKPVQHYEIETLEKAVDDYQKQTLKAIHNNLDECKEFFRIYSQEEAMDGIGEFGLGGMPNDTSAGFPISKSKKHCLKRDPMDEELVQVPREFNDNFPIQAEIDKTLEAWKTGYRSEAIYKASSKVNELLPEKKAREKVRKFYGSGIANYVASRRVLAGIPRFMRRFWRDTECLVGINATSKEWQEFHDYLTEYGKETMIAGDFSGFDTRMAAQITTAAGKILVSWYEACGVTGEDLELVRGAISDIVHPNILFQGDLYTFANGNPSGNLITVQLNGICNSLMMRYTYYSMMPKISEPFAENVRLGTYGDDNAMSVKKHCKWFNHTSCQQEFAKLDIGYTMAEKEAESVPYISIDEISFLKRGFRYDENMGRMVAPIEVDSILKKFHWVKKPNETPLTFEEQFAAYFDNALRESYLHGKAFYEDMLEKFHNIVSLNPTLKPHVAFISYEEMTKVLKPAYLDSYVSDDRKLYSESVGLDPEDLMDYESAEPEQMSRKKVWLWRAIKLIAAAGVTVYGIEKILQKTGEGFDFALPIVYSGYFAELKRRMNNNELSANDVKKMLLQALYEQFYNL